MQGGFIFRITSTESKWLSDLLRKHGGKTGEELKAEGTGLQKKQNSIQWKDWIVIDLDIDPNFSAALSWEDQAAKQINLLSYSDSKLDSKFKADQYFMGYTTKIRSTVLFKE